jgi:hypothetical protein
VPLVAVAVGLAAGAASLSAAEPAKLALELNKLESIEKGCRVYLVLTNSGDTGYAALKLDLALFQPDGVIGKRIAVDLAPVKPQKRTIKLFDLDGYPCDRIASVLLNDVTECRSDTGPVENCAAALALSSLSNVKLTK